NTPMPLSRGVKQSRCLSKASSCNSITPRGIRCSTPNNNVTWRRAGRIPKERQYISSTSKLATTTAASTSRQDLLRWVMIDTTARQQTSHVAGTKSKASLCSSTKPPKTCREMKQGLAANRGTCTQANEERERIASTNSVSSRCPTSRHMSSGGET
ncbi:hypothetical protein DQ04_17881000, partial [Trypanosoma grayi]|uniref:hypothetical protein n=1 Tax=Trypanosoma grayi TaxID=71804 RepID=UPI0004F3F2FA